MWLYVVLDFKLLYLCIVYNCSVKFVDSEHVIGQHFNMQC